MWQHQKKSEAYLCVCVCVCWNGRRVCSNGSFFFSCLPFSSDSCGSGCAYVAAQLEIDGDLPHAPAGCPFLGSRRTNSLTCVYPQTVRFLKLLFHFGKKKSVPIFPCTFCPSQINVHSDFEKTAQNGNVTKLVSLCLLPFTLWNRQALKC